MSNAHKEKLKNANIGKKMSEETKQKLRTVQRVIFKTCPYCNNGITYREYYRCHENKCKKQSI
jgi:uncharacterized protein (DUF983 family)